MYESRGLTKMQVNYMPKSHKDDYIEPFIIMPTDEVSEVEPPNAMEIAPTPCYRDPVGCKFWLNKELDNSDPVKWELLELSFPQDSWVPQPRSVINVNVDEMHMTISDDNEP